MKNVFKKGLKELSYSEKLGLVAVAGAVKQLAAKETYMVGLGAYVITGGSTKAALKTIGTVSVVGSVYNCAKFVSGDFDLDKDGN